ncbi:hypothetical protein [Rhizobium giardinii]|jgi:hypothetical protein|uniref:hypothetical protein n=1 Tax=Rhizobium giardinii TaxID=56731 RepID=UPI000DD8FFF9
MTEEQIIYLAMGVFFLFCALTGFIMNRPRTALVGLICLLIVLLVASAYAAIRSLSALQP